MVPEFFFEPGHLAFAIDDKHGVIMFVRVDVTGTRAVMHIQFSDGEQRRTAVALANVWPGVRNLLMKAGVMSVTFESKSAPLIKFCCTRLGFSPVPDSPHIFFQYF